MFELREKLKSIDVVLASQSPRRKELLGVICEDFRIVPAKGEEIIPEGLEIEKIPQQLALNKCREIAEGNVNSLVIGCDTVVVLGDRIMGKPENDEDAFEMLRALSEENAEITRKRNVVKSAIGTLSYTEMHAIVHVFEELDGKEGLLVTSKVADRAGITRSVVVNALRKFESAGVIESRSSGMKGTFIRVLNDAMYAELPQMKGKLAAV